ncbi:CocE/NonD family hydrolase [Gordonia terrae]|uniref:CocE/NonD family hydrolase n=3 Tax=Gordonia terrae TaxID=2055 RepID=A0AAD0K4I0_9ACTN|nr:CocE/NonD family hydrolase [Gordonia terrae]ANY22175.1 X-Pro dipeptidyl-peptidase [Gordonia terrae]AWO82919.1 CocE/NonD family hydrolase [Gordonia terrae]GAB46363.1 putative esterase [Gordonia terrae NBRC 100016]
MDQVVVDLDVPASMRDGVVLRADVYRPASGGPWPVLLTRLPYDKRMPGLLALIDPLSKVQAGFIVVVQDVRGRYASDGEWEPWTHEMSDGYDSVRWAAALPASSGAVGMFGASYFGNTQWMAAAARPPELKAIAPMITWSDPRDGLFSRGGAMELGISLPWSLAQGIDTLTRRHRENPAKLVQALGELVADLDDASGRTYWELPVQRHPAFVRHDIPELGYERSLREPRWVASCEVVGRHRDVEIPTLHTGGWYDIFCQGTLDNFVAMVDAGRQASLVMGPWTHTNFGGKIGEVNFGLAASADLTGFRGRRSDIENSWLKQHLADVAGAEEVARPGLPPVLLFVMGANVWREESEWPLARAVDTELYLREDSGLSFVAPSVERSVDEYVYDPSDPVPTVGGALLMSDEYPAGPLSQAAVEARSDVLVFTSQPLVEDLEVTGRIRAHLHVATDAATTDWVVRVCDVAPDGTSHNIVDGIVRIGDASSEFTEQVVDLWSTSYQFAAGHRIRVHVTSSNFPRWDRNLNVVGSDDDDARSTTARQQVAHDRDRPSRVTLPVIPSGKRSDTPAAEVD